MAPTPVGVRRGRVRAEVPKRQRQWRESGKRGLRPSRPWNKNKSTIEFTVEKSLSNRLLDLRKRRIVNCDRSNRTSVQTHVHGHTEKVILYLRYFSPWSKESKYRRSDPGCCYGRVYRSRVIMYFYVSLLRVYGDCHTLNTKTVTSVLTSTPDRVIFKVTE